MLEDYRTGLGVDREHEAADRAAGRGVTCPTLLLWSSRDDLARLYGDPVAVWQPWAEHLRGEVVESGHHMAEENPQDVAAALIDVLAQVSTERPGADCCCLTAADDAWSSVDARQEDTMSLSLRPLFTLRGDLEQPAVIGPGPYGMRQIFVVKGGAAQGERLSGKLRAGGGDWLLVGPDGIGRLDVRGTLETDDGALIYISYFGIIELSERAMQGLTEGPATEYGEITFMTQPRFETGDPRYAWLNATVCVAEGRVLPTPAVEYNVFEVSVDR